jgi:DNA-binding LacI/PurR family transcriptional regulator
VLIDRVPDSLTPLPAEYGLVVQADRKAALEATLALSKAAGGSGRIGYAGFDLAASSLRERLAGYRQAVSQLGIETQEILLYERNPASMDLETALDQALPHTRAWLASTEGIGLKLAALLTRRGYRIGENAWVARFGTDLPFLPTPLISLRQPHYKLGFQAAELLLALINRGQSLRVELNIELVHPVVDH